MIKIVSRNISNGKDFRPQPKIESNPEKNLHFIITNWGQPESVSKIITLIQDSIDQKVATDLDTTRIVSEQSINQIEPPYFFKLNQALLKANEMILKTENERSWKTIFEILILKIQNQTVHWALAGQPHLFVTTGNKIEPILTQAVGSADGLNPLPMFGLGVDSYPIVHSGYFKFEENTQVLLLSSTFVPYPLFQAQYFQVESITSILSQDLNKTSSWFGLIEGF